MTTPTPPVAIVTGANTGIGFVTARELAGQGYHVFVTCRTAEKGEQTRARLTAALPQPNEAMVDYLVMELADLEDVRRCAEAFIQQGLPLSLLVNNAGQARLRGVTEQGWENAWGINHLAPLLFTNLLLPSLSQGASPRVVTVASAAHAAPIVRGITWSKHRTPTSFTGLREYAESKLANVLFSRELSRRAGVPGLRTYALHPGAVATDVWRHVPQPLAAIISRRLLTEEQGAQTSIYCATSPEVADETGLYYDNCKVAAPSKLARNDRVAGQVWDRSMEMVGLA